MQRTLACVIAATCGAVACGTVQSETCPALAQPANGSVTAPSIELGATATYQCADGFVLTGPAERTCTMDGAWSGDEPACAKAVACPALTAPQNGTVEIAGAGSAVVATYRCEPGYEVLGAATRTCQDGGTWSGAAPSCAVTCPCFGTDGLDRIAADIAGGGTRSCLVDATNGGTMQSLIMSSRASYRIAAEALANDSLPGTHLACGFGCIASAGATCGSVPAYVRTDNISAAQHASCRARVAARCPAP